MPSFFFSKELNMNIKLFFEIMFIIVMVCISAFAMYTDALYASLICTGIMALYVWFKISGYL